MICEAKLKEGDGDGIEAHLHQAMSNCLMDRLHAHGQRCVMMSSCVPWEQSCGRQHMARVGQPSPGPR